MSAVTRSYTLAYKGYVIHLTGETSEDRFHLIDGMPAISGYGVIYGKGREYSGCNAIPGACWFTTVEDAKFAIDVLEMIGGEKNAELFHQAFDLYKDLRRQARETILQRIKEKVTT